MAGAEVVRACLAALAVRKFLGSTAGLRSGVVDVVACEVGRDEDDDEDLRIDLRGWASRDGGGDSKSLELDLEILASWLDFLGRKEKKRDSLRRSDFLLSTGSEGMGGGVSMVLRLELMMVLARWIGRSMSSSSSSASWMETMFLRSCLRCGG